MLAVTYKIANFCEYSEVTFPYPQKLLNLPGKTVNSQELKKPALSRDSFSVVLLPTFILVLPGSMGVQQQPPIQWGDR